MKEIKTLTQIQNAEKAILKEIITICSRHSIHYYLVEGTLLGAVRHKGFIPWDDDIDVAIPIAEMDDFIRYCEDELPSHLRVKAFFKEKRIAPDLTQIVDISFNIIGTSGEVHPLSVDVPSIIGVPNGRIQKWLYFYILMMEKMMVRFGSPDIILKEYWRNKTLIRRIAIWIIQKFDFSKLFPYEKRQLRLNDWLKKYPLDNNKYALLFPSAYIKHEIVPKDWYGDGADGVFEDLHVRLPAEYHKLLTAIYGDYMQLPPEEKRVPSHVQSIVSVTDDTANGEQKSE